MNVYLKARYAFGYRLVAIMIAITVFNMACLAVPARSASQEASSHDACALFTMDDAKTVLGNMTGAGSSRTSMMPAGSRCHYTYTKDAAAYGIKVTIATDETIAKEGMFASAADNFNRQKKTRKSHEYASELFSQVEKLGDDAFWSGSMLWVLKGDILLIIDSDAHLGGAFKDRQAAARAREELDLGTSIQAAQILLGKLP